MSAAESIEQVAAELVAEFRDFYSDLGAASERLAPPLRALLADPTAAGRRALQSLVEAEAQRFLDAHPVAFAAGLLVGAAPGRPPVAPMVDWFLRTADGRPARAEFVTDRDDLDFYDFERHPWFERTIEHGEPILSSPFIDWLGVDEYIVTTMSPLPAQLVERAMFGADISIEAIEPSLLRILRRAPVAAAVVNDADRIVVGSSATFLVGEQLRRGPGVREIPLDAGPRGLRLVVAA